LINAEVAHSETEKMHELRQMKKLQTETLLNG